MNQIAKFHRVGVFGHYGNNNLGDEAIIMAAIQNLRDRIPNIELKGFSMNPFDTRERHNIESFPVRFKKNYFESEKKSDENSNLNNRGSQSSNLRRYIKELLPSRVKKSQATSGFVNLISNLGSEVRFIRKARNILKDMDALVVCGSGQLVDKHLDPWGYPYTLLKWSLLAKSTDTRIFFVSMGAGPVSHPLSYWMLKKTLTRADYLSFRDHASKKLIEDHIPDLNGQVYPDIAHSLKTTSDNSSYFSDGKKVAINPMPVFDNRYWLGYKRDRYTTYIERLAELVKSILDKGEGFSINLYNNHTSDLQAIDDLSERLKKIPDMDMGKVNVTRNETVQDLINTISEADIIVATRFHSTVLPIHLGKPVLGICYHHKSKELLDNAGLGDYSVDVANFSSEELCTKFDALFENIRNLEERIKPHSRRYVELMDEQWDHIADLIKR